MRNLDPAVKLLSVLLIVFTCAPFLGEWWFKSDAQFYQTIAGLVSGISGALLLRITGHSNTDRTSPPSVPDPLPAPAAPLAPAEVKP